MERILVTGGAGFIGSHMVDTLIIGGAHVSVFDNLTAGTLANINQWCHNPNFTFVNGDLLNPTDLAKLQNNYDTVFHLAANPEVRVGTTNPEVHFQQNLVATHNLLEHLRKNQKALTLTFTSTSAIYGEAAKIPTPENYAASNPISIYGATKLACEALLSAYSHTCGFKTIIYRLANIVGLRSHHGVIYDFIQKLKKDPNELEILGDGTQTKSYLHISDCVKAILLALERSTEQFEIYNVGPEDQIDVKTIAKIVVEEMGLKDVEFKLTGGVDGGRGWKGDVKNMLLDVSKLKSLGWKPKLNSKQAVREATRSLTTELQ